MTITALPPAPSPTDTPAQFNTKAFAFVAALDDFVTEANATAVAVDADASAASASASTASGQAIAAAASASTAISEALSAASSANAAEASATAASNSANAAAASYDAFDDRYLGSKSSDPALDNDGNSLVIGALYWNSVSNVMKAWDGAAWVATYVPGSGFLTVADIGTLVVGPSETQTLTNKTIDFADNTLMGVASTGKAIAMAIVFGG
jgi:hypothetical protein